MKMDDTQIELALGRIVTAMQAAECARQAYYMSRWKAATRYDGLVHLAECQAYLAEAQRELSELIKAEYFNAMSDLQAAPNQLAVVNTVEELVSGELDDSRR